jgi:hypothetical protein
MRRPRGCSTSTRGQEAEASINTHEHKRLGTGFASLQQWGRRMTRKPKLTKAEKILKAARENPSRTCRDPNQIELFDHERQQAFRVLDEAIAKGVADSESQP